MLEQNRGQIDQAVGLHRLDNAGRKPDIRVWHRLVVGHMDFVFCVNFSPTVLCLNTIIFRWSLYMRDYPRTRITFRFPFCIPVPLPAGPPAPWFSVVFIPAFTVSTKTPVLIAGEYGDTRLANGGSGSGGIGNWRPPDFFGGSGSGDLVFAGCLPLLDELSTGADIGWEGTVL